MWHLNGSLENGLSSGECWELERLNNWFLLPFMWQLLMQALELWDWTIQTYGLFFGCCILHSLINWLKKLREHFQIMKNSVYIVQRVFFREKTFFNGILKGYMTPKKWRKTDSELYKNAKGNVIRRTETRTSVVALWFKISLGTPLSPIRVPGKESHLCCWSHFLGKQQMRTRYLSAYHSFGRSRRMSDSWL